MTQAKSIRDVNRELAKLGVPERLARGKGYYYFVNGETDRWHTQSVGGVFHISQMSVEEWVEMYHYLKAEANKWRLD